MAEEIETKTLGREYQRTTFMRPKLETIPRQTEFEGPIRRESSRYEYKEANFGGGTMRWKNKSEA